jgi:hypothetical protein
MPSFKVGVLTTPQFLPVCLGEDDWSTEVLKYRSVQKQLQKWQLFEHFTTARIKNSWHTHSVDHHRMNLARTLCRLNGHPGMIFSLSLCLLQ